MTGLADLLQAQRKARSARPIVVLPDLFLDHFIDLGRFDDLVQRAAAVHARGGGNLLTGPQSFRLGGNAANTAYALGRLGFSTILHAHTDPFGATIARETMRGLPVDLGYLEVTPRGSATAALEFHDDGSNVMLSDPGPLAELAAADLERAGDGHLLDRIAEAGAVVMTNWAQMLRHGNDIVQHIAGAARRGDAFTFLDTGDPTHRDDRQSLLQGDALRHVDAWGMNENEIAAFTERERAGDDTEALIDQARTLRQQFAGRIDVHTWREVFSLDGDTVHHCSTYDCDPRRLTGSGDAWNAGNIAGQMLGLDHDARLMLANAVATLTITSPDGRPPDWDTLVRFAAKEAPPRSSVSAR